MDSTEFLYVTYIATTREQLWTALTDNSFIERYWGVRFTTDWQPGSPLTWELDGVVIEGPDQKVIEAVPGERLTYTWHTLTDEFLEKFGGDDIELFRRAAKVPLTTVTCEIDDAPGTLKLTVRHVGFQPGSALLEGISQGWPAILSSLKTLLETGSPLSMG